jgi:carbon monoxide dehydrogenase subunit G
MATYTTTIETAWTPREAFDFMADLRNFAVWDPGVSSVEQISGDGGGVGNEFDVVISGTPMTLRYRTESHDPPCTATVRASNLLFTSIDTITVEKSGDGSLVTYDADLRLNGPLGLFDLALKPVFHRIGGRANEGLIAALSGTQR